MGYFLEAVFVVTLCIIIIVIGSKIVFDVSGWAVWTWWDQVITQAKHAREHREELKARIRADHEEQK